MLKIKREESYLLSDTDRLGHKQKNGHRIRHKQKLIHNFKHKRKTLNCQPAKDIVTLTYIVLQFNSPFTRKILVIPFC